jgi:L-amino acid N-acyltransferase YncA
MNDIRCNRDHAPQILAIFNESIQNSAAMWDYEPRTMSSMEAWFDAKERGGFPVLGVMDDAERLLAVGSYGPFRAWPAYKYTVEHSLYVERGARGRGLGRHVLTRLIAEAESQGYHTMIAAIESGNAASVALHQSLDFEKCGEIRQAGFKFGRWLNLSLYQRLLTGPANPVDGNAR